MTGPFAFYSHEFRAALIQGQSPRIPPEADCRDAFSTSDTLIEIDELDTWCLRFYDDVPDQFITPNDYLQSANSLNKFFEPLPDQTFRINFKNYVGLSRFAGFQVRVRNKKIS